MIKTLRNIQILKKRIWNDYPYIHESTRRELDSLGTIVDGLADTERGDEIFELVVEELNRLRKLVEYSDRTEITKQIDLLKKDMNINIWK